MGEEGGRREKSSYLAFQVFNIESERAPSGNQQDF